MAQRLTLSCKYDCEPKNGNNLRAYGFPTLQTSSTVTSYTLFCYEATVYGEYSKNFGAVRNSASGSISTGSQTSVGYYFSDGPATSINRIRFYQYNANSSLIPAGTRFKLYGVPVYE